MIQFLSVSKKLNKLIQVNSQVFYAAIKKH
jgi:hypothetical protein